MLFEQFAQLEVQLVVWLLVDGGLAWQIDESGEQSAGGGVGLLELGSQLAELLHDGQREHVGHLALVEDAAVAEDNALDVVVHAHGQSHDEQVDEAGEEEAIALLDRVRRRRRRRRRAGDTTQRGQLLAPGAYRLARLAQRVQYPRRLVLDPNQLFAYLAILYKKN